MQYFAQERVNKLSDLLDEIRGRRATYSSMAMRGSDPKLLYRVLFYTYLIRANTQYVDDNKKKHLVYYPPVGFFCPLGLKGVGVYPGTVLGSNVDASCAYYIKRDPELSRIANKYVALLSVDVPNVGTMLARSAVKYGVSVGGGPFAPIKGIRYIQESVERSMGLRIKESAVARDALRNVYGYKLPDELSFVDYAPSIVRRELKNASAARKRDHFKHQSNIQQSLFRNRVSHKDFVSKFLPWINHLVLTEDDAKYDPVPHPYVCCHRSVSSVFSWAGIRTHEGGNALRSKEILNFLRRIDRFFPKHYDPEMVFRILMTTDVLSNPEVLRLILVAMGMNSLKAGNAAIALIQRQKEFMMESEFMGMSYGDPFFSAVRPPNTADFPVLTPDVSVNNFLAGFVLQIQILEGHLQDRPIRFVPSLKGFVPSVKMMSDFGHVVIHKKLFQNQDPELHGLTFRY
jgi:hypothetical protein